MPHPAPARTVNLNTDAYEDCYYLVGDLRDIVKQNPQVFPKSYLERINKVLEHATHRGRG